MNYKQDSFLPNVENTASELGSKIKNSVVKLFSTGGHPLIWTNPIDFFQVVDDFLSKTNDV